MLSTARLEGTVNKHQDRLLRSQGISLFSDPRGTLILAKDYATSLPLEENLQRTPSLAAINTELQTEHAKFTEDVVGILGGREAYFDVVLDDSERMSVKGGHVGGFALVEQAAQDDSGNHPIVVHNEVTLATANPYISGYGSLLNPNELTFTYGAHVDIASDNLFWIVANGHRVIMNKVPTRNFWEKDPTETARQGVLNIERDENGKFVAIVYDASAEQRDAHKTFMREQDYRFYEISPSDIEAIVSDRKNPYDASRPIYGVKAHKVKKGPAGLFDIQARVDARPNLRYNNVIIRGLALASEAEAATPDFRTGSLIKTYADNTLMPDGKTRLSDTPEFRQTLDDVYQDATRTLAALTTLRDDLIPKQQR